jgi:pilus assembly protein Flp/PilA
MLKALLNVFTDEDGASLVEYALIVALVAVVAIAGLRILGTQANSTLSSAANSMGA